MQVQVVPLASFVHGSLDAREGHPVKLDETVAKDLERAGLVRIRARTEPGKGVDDGRGQPSFVLPVAQVLQTRTLKLPRRGEAKILRTGK
jgi:hypothetical protein